MRLGRNELLFIRGAGLACDSIPPKIGLASEARSTRPPSHLSNRFSTNTTLPVPVAFGLHDDNDWAGADSKSAASSGQLWVSEMGG